MNKSILSSALLVTGLAAMIPALAHDDDERSEAGLTIVVYGDAPYGRKAPTAAAAPDECPASSPWKPDSPEGPNPGDPRQIEATPAFIQSINRDRKVELVMFVGDTHSGSGYCTLAANQTVVDLWSEFRDPLVYTPGDNEWTDCQKAKEGGGVKNSAGEYVSYAAGHPVANLALVRSMFFPNPGETLGLSSTPSARRRTTTSSNTTGSGRGVSASTRSAA